MKPPTTIMKPPTTTFLLSFILLASVVNSSSRSGIVHDIVDDFDPDEFDLDGADISQTFSASENQDEEDMQELEVENNGWGDDDSETHYTDDDNDDGDDDDYFGAEDEDEDDEFRPPKPTKKKKKQTKKKASSSTQKKRKTGRTTSKKISSTSKEAHADQSDIPVTSPKSFIGEYIAMFLILVYAMLYFVGSSTNENHATAFMEIFYPVVRDQFHMVGETTMTLTDNNKDLTKWEARKLITKESQSQYRLYATGRKNIKGMTLDIKLIDRQDLFYMVTSYLTGANDMVCVDIPMDIMASFVLAIVPAKDATKYRDMHNDIKELTTEQKQWRAYLPNHLELLSDASFPTIAPLLLSSSGKSPSLRSETKEMLTSPYFHSLHFTDMVSIG